MIFDGRKRERVFLFKELHSPLTKNLISVFVCPEGKRGGKGPKKVVSFCLFISQQVFDTIITSTKHYADNM